MYKIKPKLPAQFKAAESNAVPFALILGEDELAAGKVRIKEMGLQEGHPEKDGVLIDLAAVVTEVKTRLERRNTNSSGIDNLPVDQVTEKVESLGVEAKQ